MGDHPVPEQYVEDKCEELQDDEEQDDHGEGVGEAEAPAAGGQQANQSHK